MPKPALETTDCATCGHGSMYHMLQNKHVVNKCRKFACKCADYKEPPKRNTHTPEQAIDKLIVDLQEARADGTIYTYGEVQDRLRQIKELF